MTGAEAEKFFRYWLGSTCGTTTTNLPLRRPSALPSLKFKHCNFFHFSWPEDQSV